MAVDLAGTYTIAEIDQALHNANTVPLDERGPIWQAFVDRLLDQRNQASQS